MYESSLEYLRCVKCQGMLDLEIFEKKDEVVEGMLSCGNCNARYPVISKIAFLVEDLSLYFSIRTKLGGQLMVMTRNQEIKSLVKNSLKHIKHIGDDTTDLERNWVNIYKKSANLQFYRKIKKTISKLTKCDTALEHGCSIGTATEMLTKDLKNVFGVDKSFFALLEAKKRKIKKADFFVADSLSHPFGKNKFDMVLAFNVLELIEPSNLVEIICSQAQKFVLLSDPYDYERGKNSVKIRLDERSLRRNIIEMGFKLIQETAKPSFIPWRLDVNPRLKLHYKADLVIAEKTL